MAPADKGSSSQAQPAGAAYGIDEMIALMRTLRNNNENDDLIISIVKKTLESVNVQIPDVINAATERQRKIKERIASLEAHITAFDMQILVKRNEITARNTDYDETSHVKARLEIGLNVDADQAARVRILLARRQLARRHDSAEHGQRDRNAIATPRKTTNTSR